VIIELFVRFLCCEKNLMVLTCVYELLRVWLTVDTPRVESAPVRLAQTIFFVSSVLYFVRRNSKPAKSPVILFDLSLLSKLVIDDSPIIASS
jgi:hypothetical protein